MYGKIVACSFCGWDNHDVSICWKRMAAYRKQKKEKKKESKGTLDKENHAIKKMQKKCTY